MGVDPHMSGGGGRGYHSRFPFLYEAVTARVRSFWNLPRR